MTAKIRTIERGCDKIIKFTKTVQKIGRRTNEGFNNMFNKM